LQPSEANGAAVFRNRIEGPVVMLNLLRFRAVADYSASPEIAPDAPVSGRDAFDIYIRHTLPHLRASGGELLFLGSGGPFLIGPEGQGWDCAMLVRQASLEAFVSHAVNEAYMAGIGHRTAALADSRLLPLVERSIV
jgi:hypothetical protein